MSDPGFEQEIDVDEPGFGWRRSDKVPAVRVSRDNINPKAGHASLRVEFNGEYDPLTPAISQLVLVEPGTRYQLSFAIRTEEIVSGGLPKMVVVDAGDDNRVIVESRRIPLATSGWREEVLDFHSETSNAVRIVLRRERCSTSPCPIFGRLWLDEFFLKKL